MRKHVIQKNPGGSVTIDDYAAKSLEKNGTFIPDVSRVIYSLKTTETVPIKGKDGKVKTETVLGKDGKPRTDRFGNPVVRNVTKEVDLENPILTTSVFWADGTVSRVKNSCEDGIGVETVTLGNGAKVKVADRRSKETGLVYAVTKRTCGIPNGKTGEVNGTGLGRILTQIVDSAFDQDLEDAKAKMRKAELKAKAAKAKAEREAKPKRYTDNDIRQNLGRLLEAFAEKASKDPKFLDRFSKAMGA